MHDIQKKLHDAFLNKASTEISGTKGVGSAKSSDAIEFYRSGYLIRIRESMDDRFNIFQKVFNDYKSLRENYIQENPSSFYSLDDYGLTFSKWLKQNDYKELMVDLASLEEQLDLFTRKEVDIDNGLDLTKINTDIKIGLSGVQLLKFDSAVYDVWFEEKTAADNHTESLVMIYYSKDDLMVKKLNKWQFALLKAFETGQTLEKATQQIEISESEMVQFQSFFQFLAQNKLLQSI